MLAPRLWSHGPALSPEPFAAGSHRGKPPSRAAPHLTSGLCTWARTRRVRRKRFKIHSKRGTCLALSVKPLVLDFG